MDAAAVEAEEDAMIHGCPLWVASVTVGAHLRWIKESRGGQRTRHGSRQGWEGDTRDSQAKKIVVKRCFVLFFWLCGGGCGVVSAIGGGTHLIGGQRVEAADNGEVVTHDGARASVLRSRRERRGAVLEMMMRGVNSHLFLVCVGQVRRTMNERHPDTK